MSFIKLVPSSSSKLPSIPSESDENIKIEKTYWKSRRQLFATAVLNIGSFSLGTVFGWAAGGVESLQKEKNINFDVATVASLFSIGALASGPLAGYFMAKKGRKLTLIVFAICLLIGWALIPLAKPVASRSATGAGIVIYAGRFFTGFAAAGCFTIAQIYIKEVTDDAHRAILSGSVPLAANAGNFVGFLFGIALSWFWLSVICTIFPVILLITIYWIPETPSQVENNRYLFSKEKPDQAKIALNWLNAGYAPEERERMFRRLRRIVEFLNAHFAMRLSQRRRMEERRRLRITSRPVIRPLLVSMFLIFFQQASGANLVLSYSIDILNSGGKSLLSPQAGTLLLGAIYLVFVGIATFSVERMGRKPLLFWSALLMTNVHIILGIYFYFLQKGSGVQRGNAVKYFFWIPIFSLNLCIVGYAIGLGSVAWLVITELSHPDFQEISGTCTITVYWITAYATIQLYPSLRDALGMYTCFWILGFMSLIGTLFVHFAIFETKGKSQEEIMAHYKGHLYTAEEDELEDSRSVGSIRRKGSLRNKGSKQSVTSDWSTELVTLIEAREQRTSIG